MINFFQRSVLSAMMAATMQGCATGRCILKNMLKKTFGEKKREYKASFSEISSLVKQKLTTGGERGC